MAVDIYLGADGDIDFTNGAMRLTTNIEESSVQQGLIVLKTFRGEWFANIAFGIPYLANDNNDIHLLGKSRKGLVDAYIQDALLTRENIKSIESYTSVASSKNNNLTVTVTAITNSGEVITLTTET